MTDKTVKPNEVLGLLEEMVQAEIRDGDDRAWMPNHKESIDDFWRDRLD